MDRTLAVLLFLLGSTNSFQCPSNYCDTIQCDKSITKEKCTSQGGLLVNGDVCGCCQRCEKQLGEGDSCFLSFLLQTLAGAKCGPGLMCDARTFKCVLDFPCLRLALAARFSKLLRVDTPINAPECDDDGKFKGKQCSKTQCYCVDETGLTIKGYEHYKNKTTSDIKCGCARSLSRYKSCDENGDYRSMQCDDSDCYCVDKYTGEKLKNSPTMRVFAGSQISCPDIKSGKKCADGSCFCTDKQGIKIAGYDHPLTETRTNISCGCAQEKNEYAKTGLIGKIYMCDKFGDYDSVQCTGSVCRCVDKVSGKQIGDATVNIGQISSLNC